MSEGVKVLTGLVVVAGLTTLVLPQRLTPQIIEKFWTGFAGATKAATGR